MDGVGASDEPMTPVDYGPTSPVNSDLCQDVTTHVENVRNLGRHDDVDANSEDFLRACELAGESRRASERSLKTHEISEQEAAGRVEFDASPPPVVPSNVRTSRVPSVSRLLRLQPKKHRGASR